MFTDIRHALRLFLKNPVLYGVAIVTLAAGIGGNATIFSITHAFLYPELAFEAPEELVLLRTGDARTGEADGPLSLASYLALRDAVPSLQSLEALDRDSVRWAAGDGAAEQLAVARTTAGFFTTLGVSAERGRVLATGEDRPGAQPVVLLTHGLWQRRFGSDQAIVGRSLELDGTAHTVIGVLAENFEYFDSSFEVFMPLQVDEAGTADWTTTVSAIGRLDPGASAAQMEREVAAVGARLAEQSPEHMRQRALLGETVPDAFPGRTDQMLVKILMTGVGFVLLIACANIANLLLARGEARRTEIATRAALGAGSGRLARQLVTESLLLALLGGVAGVGVAAGGVRFLQASMPPDMPRGFVPELDLAVLLFTFAATLGCGLLFGAIQVFFVSRGQLAGELREGARGTGSRKRGWLRNSLVVSQMAFAAILLVGTSVMATAFMEHMLVDTGIDETGKLTVALERPKDEEPAAGAAFYRRC